MLFRGRFAAAEVFERRAVVIGLVLGEGTAFVLDVGRLFLGLFVVAHGERRRKRRARRLHWTQMMEERPIVCVDLNGVLDSYAGWRGAEHWDPPRAGAADFLRSLRERGYHVVIHTTRWREDAFAWLRQHELDALVDDVTNEKLPAHVFVDDRAVCFRGDFDATLDAIDHFQAHWEARS